MQTTHLWQHQKQHRVGFWVLVLAALVASTLAITTATVGTASADEIAPPLPPPTTGPPSPPATVPAPSEPTLFPTVVPSSGLVDDQTVVVTVTDLPSRANVVAVQCAATASGQDECDLSYTEFAQASSDGVYEVEFVVARQIRAQDELLDCAPDNCIIGVGLLADDLYTPLETGGLAINFDASAPLAPPPTVKVVKNGKLKDGQTVRVKGADWSPDSFEVSVEQCFSVVAERGEGIAQSCRYGGSGIVTVDGRLNFKTNVQRSHYFGERRVDCADGAVSCSLIVRSYQRRMQEGSTELIFSDKEPLSPRVKVNLKPRKSLTDGDTISVRLKNATLDYEWSLMQCVKFDSAESVDGGFCRYLQFDLRDGVGDVEVSRTILINREIIDCAAARNRCFIQAMNYNTQATVKRGLIFSPTTEPAPKPSVVFSDNLDGLTDRTTVTADVTGPFNEVILSQCPAAVKNFMRCTNINQYYEADGGYDEPVPEAEEEPADPAEDEAEEVTDIGVLLPLVSASQTVTVEGLVNRTLWHDGEAVDCAAEAGACTLVAWSYEYGRIGSRALLTFVDEGPLALPAVEMKNTDLAQREAVTATFTGLPAGRYLSVMQCVRTEEYFCRYLPGHEIDASDFVVDVEVNRLLRVDAEPFDCGIEAEACEMRFSIDGERGPDLRVPLTFDPDAPPPTSPEISVKPRTKLKHRQQVEVSIGGVFGYFGVAQCPSESSPQSNDCTYVAWDGWEMDEDAGASVVTVQVRRVLATSSLGRVDCAETKRRCKLVIIDGEYGDTLGDRWITFDGSLPAPPPPTLTATPSTNLVDGQEIEISASGDSEYLSVMQCAGELSGNDYPRRCREVASLSFEDAPATFVAGVSRMLVGNDCARVACSLVLFNQNNGQVEAQQPLTFDPDAKRLGTPKLAVTPTSGLVDRQPVEATLTGLVSWYNFRQCVVVDGTTTDSCINMRTEYEPIRRTVVTSTLTVRRVVNGHDCAAVARSCALVMDYSTGSQYYDEGEARQRRKMLTFDPDAEPFPGPTVTVDPATGLADGDLVNVVGSGFASGFEVYVGLCTADFKVDDRGDFVGSCANEPSGYAEIAEDGSFSIDVPVQSEFEGFEGDLKNCVDTACAILVTDGNDFVLVGISFDPEAPAAEQLVVNGLSWPKELVSGSPAPTNGFSLLPRLDLQSG